MEWSDVGLVLGTRRLGEADAVLELMTLDHGRHLGVVKGGRSRRRLATLQTGNRLAATWRARLDEHLGTYTVEPLDARAALLMGDAVGLDGLQTLAAHLRLLPERDPHPDLFGAAETLLDALADPARTGVAMVRFELDLIESLGFGLDLSACALTGTSDDLAWVSPRTGRAAAREAGRPYADRLLPLPAFLVDAGTDATVTAADVAAGFRLTGHFLMRHVWEPRRLTAPPARDALVAALARRAAGS